MKKNIYNIGLLAAVGFSAILTGCSNDFDFDEARRENPEFVYKENFEKAFGTIDPNQSWDFTGGGLFISGTRAIAQKTLNNQWSTTYKEINKTVFTKINEYLGESAPNLTKGSKIVWTVPNNDFMITPIFQGYNNSSNVHLYMQVEGVDTPYLIWSKGERLQVKKYSNSSWTNCSNDANNGTTLNGGRNVAYAIRGQTLTIHKGDLPIGATITFYSTASYDSKDYVHSSNEGEILELDTKVYGMPFTVTEGHETKILSCEAGYDEDLNDILFLVEGGPIAPQKIDIKDGKYDKEKTYSKRYMVEDLGATEVSDIDFNDIVIDLTSVTTEKHETKTTNGVLTEDKVVSSTSTSTAKVRALGGTKNLAVYIQSGTTPNPSTDRCIFVKQGKQNNTTYYNNTATSNGFEASYMYNTVYSSNTEQAKLKNHLIDYDTDITLATVNLGENAGWDPDKNNIYVVVSDKQSVGLGYDPDETDRVIGFPEDGTVPFMIAVDKDTPWNWERANIFQTLDANTGHVLQLKDGSEWSLKDYPKK